MVNDTCYTALRFTCISPTMLYVSSHMVGPGKKNFLSQIQIGYQTSSWYATSHHSTVGFSMAHFAFIGVVRSRQSIEGAQYCLWTMLCPSIALSVPNDGTPLMAHFAFIHILQKEKKWNHFFSFFSSDKSESTNHSEVSANSESVNAHAL